MPQFDRVDGQFVAPTKYMKQSDRFAFKRAKWQFDFRRKAWWTADPDKALILRDWAMGAAKEYLDNAAAIREAAVASSWAEDTITDFPAPDGLEYMPFQKAGIEYCIKRKRTLIADEMGLGKAQPDFSKVLTPSGWQTIGSLKIGDVIIGSKGKTKVTGVFPQGIKETYEISFSNGAKAFSSADHLWSVRENGRRSRKDSYVVKKLSDVLSDGVKYPRGANKWDVPVYDGIGIDSKELFIEPYLMGILLGDGSFRNSSINFCVGDNNAEIVQLCSDYIDESYVLKEYKKEGNSDYYIVKKCGGSGENIYNTESKKLGLWDVLGKDKFIPDIYAHADLDSRLMLLRGLMDSDGSVNKNTSGARFHSNSKTLAEDVQKLVWSLGGDARVQSKTRTGRNTEYTVSIQIKLNPFSLARKSDHYTSSTTDIRRFIQSVRSIGMHEHVCISVECPHRLYVTDDYTLTHNTIQAIGVSNQNKPESVLIVCPASLKVNWKREWERWDVDRKSVGIAHSKTRSKKVDGVNKSYTEHIFPDTDVVIINYDVLDTYDEKIKSQEWGLVIYDEAHLLKTPTSIRTMCVFGGTLKANKRTGKKRKEYTPIEAQTHLYLTGTPIMSRPVELWNIVKSCDPEGLGRSWNHYTTQYCAAEETAFGFDVSGASNLDELNRLLRERFMVRRDKMAVLKELPDLTRELILLPKDKLEAPIKKELSRVEKALHAYESGVLDIDTSNIFRYIEDISTKLAEALEAQTGEEPDWDGAVKTLSPPEQIMFTEISAAREEVALAKVGMVVEHIEKLVGSDEPVICFGYHKSVIKEIKERLEKRGLRVGVITGDVNPDKRQDIVDDFQDEHIDVILGNIIAMGVGLTMTRGRFVVFAEMDWVPSLLAQAEARAWRKGQKNSVMAQYLMVDGSIESRMAIALLEKMGVIKEALD